MAIFQTTYNVLGAPLVGIIRPVGATISTELAFYPHLKRAAENYDWNYFRLETAGKDGMADVLVTNGAKYSFIEVKRLKKKALKSVEDDLTWQFGQLAFMKKCLRNKTHYILAIVNERSALYLKGEGDETWNFPDFIEQF